MANLKSEATHLSPDETRAELERQSIPYTADAFVDKASEGDLAVVRLFVNEEIDLCRA